MKKTGLSVNMSDYRYELPDERVAKYPLEKRDSSKLLISTGDSISHTLFSKLPDVIPENSLMIFNNTKVIPARLLFQKDTGAVIEIFCLEPVDPDEYILAFASIGKCRWRAVIGNVKRWKTGRIAPFKPFDFKENSDPYSFRAELLEREKDSFLVEFSWSGEFSFSEILDFYGKIPIPPYLRRESEAIDSERYQTLYAKYKGSVAAPTAGLHFTEEVLTSLKAKNIITKELSLHVGAGTFIPVKSEDISDHRMHSEPFSVSMDLLYSLLEALRSGKDIIAVGTTSARTLESLYYLGIKAISTPEAPVMRVDQWEPYKSEYKYTIEESLEALINYLDRCGKDVLEAKTEIIIVPGFRFRILDILITNFHQPQSTLLLLISAFVGGEDGERWKSIYDYALNNGFRFLSYGDSSILFRS